MDREAFERARSAYGTGAYDDATLEFLFPQLKESEDERIRKGIIEIIKAVSGPDCDVYLDEKKQEKYIAWLEKQKENPQSADSIPADCVSDVKCEDRWHKVTDSLPDNPREVLCKDEAGNYFIGRYYVGEGWDISNYDDEDKPHHLNPPVSKWIDFPSEKQKEPENVSASTMIPSCWAEKQKEQKPWKVGANAYFTPEQKPAEWSEEDEKMLELVIANYEYMFDKLRKGDDSDGIPDHILIMDWLKSLPERFSYQTK